jgi:hypothetical protein
MRHVLAAVLALGFVGAALAASTPTAEQCKNGYKAQYSKTWSKDQFTKACADMKTPAKK